MRWLLYQLCFQVVCQPDNETWHHSGMEDLFTCCCIFKAAIYGCLTDHNALLFHLDLIMLLLPFGALSNVTGTKEGGGALEEHRARWKCSENVFIWRHYINIRYRRIPACHRRLLLLLLSDPKDSDRWSMHWGKRAWAFVLVADRVTGIKVDLFSSLVSTLFRGVKISGIFCSLSKAGRVRVHPQESLARDRCIFALWGRSFVRRFPWRALIFTAKESVFFSLSSFSPRRSIFQLHMRTRKRKRSIDIGWERWREGENRVWIMSWFLFRFSLFSSSKDSKMPHRVSWTYESGCQLRQNIVVLEKFLQIFLEKALVQKLEV